MEMEIRAMLTLAFILGAVALGCSTACAAGSATPQSFQRTLTLTVKGQYLLYLPPGYEKEPEKKWPLILFLHGAGERGDDVQRVKIHGPIKVAESLPEGLPFIIAAPLCPTDRWWDRMLPELTGLLDEVSSRWRVDTERIYCTGLSMGGFGTWALVSEHPERFAAAAPICGGGNPWLACRMKDVPVWAFHGAKDTVVPLEQTERMVDALKKCGAEPRLTVYPEAQHDSWTETYNNPGLYEWFLQHRRGK